MAGLVIAKQSIIVFDNYVHKQRVASAFGYEYLGAIVPYMFTLISLPIVVFITYKVLWKYVSRSGYTSAVIAIVCISIAIYSIILCAGVSVSLWLRSAM